MTHRNAPDHTRNAATTLPFLLVSLAVLIGIVGLDLDGGRLMDERRHAQAAADAAALAAAAELYRNYWTRFGKDPNGTAAQAAQTSASGNGYSSAAITVNIPPKSGAFTGQSSYVEVILETTVAGSFSAIFTPNPLTVRARSVALGRPLPLGIIAMRSSGASALQNNALALSVINHPIIVNSSDGAAYNQAGPGLVIASRMDIAGNYINPGGALILGKVRTGVSPVPDPLASLPIPDAAQAPVQSTSTMTIDPTVPLPVTLQPGVYQGGLNISGIAVVNMSPGTYIMQGGGFTVGGTATVLGLGVTVYNTTGGTPSQGITINTLGEVVLAAPLSGTYQGISFFQDRSLTDPVAFQGMGVTTITGVIYALSAAVSLTGLASVGADILGGAYVSDTISISGVGGINIDLGLNPPRIPDIRLAE